MYHIGGIHSGSAIFSTIWFVAFTVDAMIQKANSAAVLAVSYVLVTLLVAMIVMAYPTFRIKHHDLLSRALF